MDTFSYGGRFDREPVFNCVPGINKYRQQVAHSPINKELLESVKGVFSAWKSQLDDRFGEQNYREEYLNRIQVALTLSEDSGSSPLTIVTLDWSNKGSPTKGEFSLTFDDVEVILIKLFDGNACWVNPYQVPPSEATVAEYALQIVNRIHGVLSDSKKGIIKESEAVLYPPRSDITDISFGGMAGKQINAPIIEFFSFPERSTKKWVLLRSIFHSSARLKRVAEKKQQLENFLTSLLTDPFLLASYWRWVVDEGVSTSKELTAGEKQRIRERVMSRDLPKLTNIEILKLLASPAYINELADELAEKRPKEWEKDLR